MGVPEATLSNTEMQQQWWSVSLLNVQEEVLSTVKLCSHITISPLFYTPWHLKNIVVLTFN